MNNGMPFDPWDTDDEPAVPAVAPAREVEGPSQVVDVSSPDSTEYQRQSWEDYAGALERRLTWTTSRARWAVVTLVVLLSIVGGLGAYAADVALPCVPYRSSQWWIVQLVEPLTLLCGLLGWSCVIWLGWRERQVLK